MMDANKQTPKHPWDESIRTILFALLLAVCFRSVAFEPFHIPSGSMKSTLLVGDYLFVSKYTYGYSRYSFPFGLPIFHGRVMELRHPQRGDVVVFRPPGLPNTDFIKRIMGLPGDKLQMKDGILYINDKPLARKQVDDFTDAEDMANIHPVEQFVETLPEGKTHMVLREPSHALVQEGIDPNNTPVYTVPPDHYFMMGDNRDNSGDSRFPSPVGYVPEENIVGRAELIFFSTDGTAQLDNPVSWFRAMRFNRFFDLIH